MDGPLRGLPPAPSCAGHQQTALWGLLVASQSLGLCKERKGCRVEAPGVLNGPGALSTCGCKCSCWQEG